MNRSSKKPSRILRHFHEKLLLLKDTMNTETARQIAETRHAFREAFLKELNEETGGSDHE